MSCVHQPHLTHLFSIITTYAFYFFSPSPSFSIYFLMVLPFFLFDQKYLCGKPLTFASLFDLLKYKTFHIIPLLLSSTSWTFLQKFILDLTTIHPLSFLSLSFLLEHGRALCLAPPQPLHIILAQP
jgi:hypothetical protein